MLGTFDVLTFPERTGKNSEVSVGGGCGYISLTLGFGVEEAAEWM